LLKVFFIAAEVYWHHLCEGEPLAICRTPVQIQAHAYGDEMIATVSNTPRHKPNVEVKNIMGQK
jgi:hypothetical protein